MKSNALVFATVVLGVSGAAAAAPDVTCIATPFVFKADGEIDGLEGVQKDLKMTEHKVPGSKDAGETYFKAEPEFDLGAGAEGFRVFATVTVEKKNPDLLRVMARAQKVAEGRVVALSGPIESAHFYEVVEGLNLSVASTVTLFANPQVNAEVLNKDPKVSTADLEEKVLRSGKAFAGRLSRVQLHCMSSQR